MNSHTTHNLNIENYSFEDILKLFHLSYTITQEQMVKTKKQVLLMHPDKSRLPPEYFHFYRKAYTIVLNYYNEQNRQNQKQKPTNYDAGSNYEFLDKKTGETIRKNVSSMDKDQFQKLFNSMYEKNVEKSAKNKNEWFSKEEESPYQTNVVVNKSNMSQVFENMKSQNQGLVVHKGVQDFMCSHGSNSYYEDIEDDMGLYISSDPFSKLKFDDLRKVHKDQTIFAVSEKDFEKMPKYKSANEYKAARNQNLTVTTAEQLHADKIRLEQERIYKETMARKQHEAYLNTMKNAEKGQSVLSYFLQLQN